MRRLRASKKFLRRQKKIADILARYQVPRYAYGFCPECNSYYDFWKYDDGKGDFRCPGCNMRLNELSEEELAEALLDCEGSGCFSEEFAYATPLKPVQREEVV